MLRIGVLVSGGGTNLQSVIDNIESGFLKNVEISLVLSSNPEAFALKRAERHGINGAVICPNDYEALSDYENALIDACKNKGCQLLITAGYMSILPEKFINAFENRIINVHPSLIPSFCGKGYYGLKVHEAALKKGVKITGATVHFVNNIVDGGPIILQKPVEVLDEDTPEVLQKRVMEQAEWKILPEAVALYSQNRLIIENNRVRRLEA